MANINETIANVEKLDPELARQLRKYVKDHSYGLVFEHNLPEAVRLYTKTAAVGDTVNIRPERGKDETDENKVAWNVKAVKDGMAAIENGTEEREVAVEDLVPIVSYRDVIYPGLREVDRIERGDKDDPYQVVINAENYHALEMLAYCYAGKVDCIYIDPPYNTGAKDWKYNNDYVDGNDQYRHSKWLAFMERRLKLAKRLLNPADSVLIVTIDEKEYARLGLLLEQMFPEARVQMVSTCISSHGNQRTNQFSRSDEYIYFVEFGTASVQKVSLSDDWRVNPKDNRIAHARWIPFLRSGNRKTRNDSPNCFYPIYISKKGKKFLGVGDVLPKGEHPDLTKEYSDKIEIWPVREDGSEGCWCATSETLLELQANHFFRIGRRTKYGSSFSYLYSAERKKVEKGLYKVSGIAEDGSYLFDDSGFVPKFIPMTQWSIKSHDASIFGTQLLHDIFKDKRFPFPKSVYAVRDALRFFVSNKPDALIIDFFAGSGTTLQAVNLLNIEDGGHRRCVCVTNNEVSVDEQKVLMKKGLRQGDTDWEARGIAQYVTWPRTKCTIEGVDVSGAPLKGNYIGPDDSKDSDMPMSDGFKANAIFFDLTYESAWPIRLDNAFDAIAPILWMQAGARGPIIKRVGKSYLITDYYGVLFDYGQASKFVEAIKKHPNIKTAFVVTDDQRRYSNMCRRLPGIEVHRLYETFLKTFEICGEGGLD